MIFLISIVVVAFFWGSLPISRFVVRVLTVNGRFAGDRYVALIRVMTDIAKGSAAAQLGHEAGIVGAQLAVLAVYLGHIFPIGRGFGQQNGTGTLLGALIILDPLIGLMALSSWMFAYYIYRHATYSAVLSAILTTTIFAFVGAQNPVKVELLILLTLVVLWRHRRYIQI